MQAMNRALETNEDGEARPVTIDLYRYGTFTHALWLAHSLFHRLLDRCRRGNDCMCTRHVVFTVRNLKQNIYCVSLADFAQLPGRVWHSQSQKERAKLPMLRIMCSLPNLSGLPFTRTTYR